MNLSHDSIHQLNEAYGIHLQLAQYPVLGGKIRQLMRSALFTRGIITLETFEAEAREKAIMSQYREGLRDPFGQEPEYIWYQRLAVIRDQLTDFYFAYNFPPETLEEIIQIVLVGHSTSKLDHELSLTFNPELAPWDLLFAQAQAYEALPPDQWSAVQHHLREIIVVLIKGMLSDQLEFVGIAKELLTIKDLIDVRRRCIGRGKIGGKAAGILLARKILEIEDQEDIPDLHKHVTIPESYYIGADVFYDFLLINDFTRYMNQKYRTAEEIEKDYPIIQQSYVQGHFPSEIIYSLRQLLEELGKTPLIVRSSSLLEVHFGAALAGKYKSVFCPNQGTLEENLAELQKAIAVVYASTLSPDALLYRKNMGLIDYDERMAVLIQKVQGTHYHQYFFPPVAGVGYSLNPFRWNPKIKREAGFLRLVSGFGTRAVDRVANDYPRIIALSHPQLRPYVGVTKMRKYSQHFIDVVDMETNQMKTLPVPEVIKGDFPSLRYLASIDMGDYMSPIITRISQLHSDDLVLTFDQLTQDKNFISLMHGILQKLQRYHHSPIDIEFAVSIKSQYPHTEYTVHLLQCRPLVSKKQIKNVEIPDTISESDLIFQATKLVPQGIVYGVRYIVHVPSEEYSQTPDYETKTEIARIISQLNKKLEGENYILIGPGRWGSSEADLGVRVTYADIFNTRVLIEVPLKHKGSTAEPSYGTHFFQDLVETGIFPLPINPGEDHATLNMKFLKASPNILTELLPKAAPYAQYVKVIDVPAVTGGRYLDIIMNDEEERAVGYLKARK
ncbi:MAG: hypothetical protein E4H27_03565 [Anaerolineales bacterium]|nr:MAG: hypothetical protein E4H27_03565 [Anaerolineales bacterium]